MTPAVKRVMHFMGTGLGYRLRKFISVLMSIYISCTWLFK